MKQLLTGLFLVFLGLIFVSPLLPQIGVKILMYIIGFYLLFSGLNLIFHKKSISKKTEKND